MSPLVLMRARKNKPLKFGNTVCSFTKLAKVDIGQVAAAVAG